MPPSYHLEDLAFLLCMIPNSAMSIDLLSDHGNSTNFLLIEKL